MQLPEAGFSGTATKPLSRATLTSLLQQHLPCLNMEQQPARNGNHGHDSEKLSGLAEEFHMEASDESTAEQKSVNRRERLGRTKAVPILAPLQQGQDNSGTSTPKQGIKVLLVEDSIANQVMLQRSIKRNGRVLLGAEPTVTTCSNGREALMELSEQRYDLVFMDLHMPIMGGMRAVQEIRKTYAKETLPVIAITGSEDPAGTDTSSVTHITTGFNEVGVKPTDNEHMQRLLRSHLRCLADPVSGVIDLGSTCPSTLPKLLTCLVAEDDGVSMRMMGRMLQSNGIRMVQAVDGEAAVVAAMARSPDVILMDCNMPIKDGWQAARDIRAWETLNGRDRIPIIAVTANAMYGDREGCLAAGMDDHVAKPVDASTLMAAIARWVGSGSSQSSPRMSCSPSTVLTPSTALIEAALGGKEAEQHVLLVDEGLALLLDAKWSLEAEGFIVDVAENGLRALDIFRGRTKAYAAVVVADGLSVLNAIDTATGIVKAAAEAGLPVPPLLLLESALSGTGRVPGSRGLVRRRSSLDDVPPPFRYVVRAPVQALQLSMVLAACGLKTSGTIPDVSRLRRYDAEAIHGSLAICVSENSTFTGVLKQVLANSGVGCTHLSDGALLATELATTSYDCVILDRCCGVSDLISKVRSRHASLPVLVLAPHGSSSAEAAEFAGADEVLPFPVHHSALMGALFLLTTAAKNTHEGGAEAARRSSFRPRPPMDLTEPLHLCMGDWQTVLTMLTSYVEKGLKQLAALDCAVTSCDIKAIQTQAHRLKADSHTNGVPRMACLCQELEELAGQEGVDPEAIALAASHLQRTFMEIAGFQSALGRMTALDIGAGLKWAGGDLEGMMQAVLSSLQRAWAELQAMEEQIRGGDMEVVLSLTEMLMGPEIEAAASKLYSAALDARSWVKTDGDGHNALRLLWRELERLRTDLKLLKGTMAVQLCDG